MDRVFSLRYNGIFTNKDIEIVDIDKFKIRVVRILEKYDIPTYYHPYPGNSWTENSSSLFDAREKYLDQHGVSKLPLAWLPLDVSDEIKGFLANCHPIQLLDFIELMYQSLPEDSIQNFSASINDAFEFEKVDWRLLGGVFVKLDANFVSTLTREVHDKLEHERYNASRHEFLESISDNTAGDTKDAILKSAKSVESLLKVICNKPGWQYEKLLDKMSAKGYFDGFPEDKKPAILKILKSYIVLRNEVAAHGDGLDVNEVPKEYGELAINIAASFNLFLMNIASKHNDSINDNKKPPPTGGELPF